MDRRPWCAAVRGCKVGHNCTAELNLTQYGDRARMSIKVFPTSLYYSLNHCIDWPESEPSLSQKLYSSQEFKDLLWKSNTFYCLFFGHTAWHMGSLGIKLMPAALVEWSLNCWATEKSSNTFFTYSSKLWHGGGCGIKQGIVRIPDYEFFSFFESLCESRQSLFSLPSIPTHNVGIKILPKNGKRERRRKYQR